VRTALRRLSAEAVTNTNAVGQSCRDGAFLFGFSGLYSFEGVAGKRFSSRLFCTQAAGSHAGRRSAESIVRKVSETRLLRGHTRPCHSSAIRPGMACFHSRRASPAMTSALIGSRNCCSDRLASSDATDVSMRHLSRDAYFAAEAFEQVGAARGGRRQELERDLLSQLQIRGSVDFAHASSSEQAQDAVPLGQHGTGWEAAFINGAGRGRLTRR
jgi:hypothetical protein